MIVQTQPFWRLRGGGESRKLYAGQEFVWEMFGSKIPERDRGDRIILRAIFDGPRTTPTAYLLVVPASNCVKAEV